MIDPAKLYQMHGGFRRRKLILTLGALERDILGITDNTLQSEKFGFTHINRADYIKKIAEIIIEDPKLPQHAREQLKSLLSEHPLNERRICNNARNALLEIIGTPSAEWDLIIAPHPGYADAGTEAAVSTVDKRCDKDISAKERPAVLNARPFYKDVFIYAEDIRSPFNLGSIFRTAEAFGAEKLFLSPLCTNPAHPRALRSAMGCIDFLPHERLSLDELSSRMPDVPVFALETGGTPIEQFDFPERGIVIIGSEELGINPESLKKAGGGTVSIPVIGVKASLNVGVALGILMHSWTSRLEKRKTYNPI